MIIQKEPVLAMIAILMGIVSSYVLYLSRNSAGSVRIIIVYLLLAMMNGMLLGPAIYFSGIFSLSVDSTIILTAGIMSLEMVYPIFIFINGISNPHSVSNINLKLLIVATLLNEFLMSLDFNSYISGISVNALYNHNIATIFANTISSYWFIFPMALEMFLTAFLAIRREYKKPFTFIAFQSAIMFLTPTALNGSFWLSISVYTGGILMTIILVYLFESLYRDNSINTGFANYVIAILLTYALMMIGVLFYQYNSDKITVSMAIILEMIIYINAIVRPGYFRDKGKIIWIANRRWSTGFLLAVFIAEFAMGATFDLQYFGAARFLSAMALTSISGSIPDILSATAYDSIIFIGSITGSSWFLIMMGFEMGSLVVFKILKTRELENRIRLGLLIGAYAIYTILIPSFVIPDAQIYPFLGWSMGIGTGGGLLPYLIIPMLLTYVLSGSLSLLFGARQLCSVFCTAPLMYQGTFYDSMKKFNRTSGTAKYISTGGEKNAIYRIVSMTVYLSLAVAAILSLLDSYHITNYTLYGTDPLFFIYIILFDIMWYAVFITMPFFGSYGCINTGYCHWGNFNRFIGRFGLFRLRVKDTDQCVTCKTKDCATACPVGLSSQPGSFISSGEFRNSRCVGIGDCVEACPYENIFFFDVRHFLKEKLSRK